MSGDTILAIVAVSLTAISSPFSPSSAIECGNATGHPGGGRWRSEPGLAAGNNDGMKPERRPPKSVLFWSMTIDGPMMRAGRVATLDGAKAQFK